MTEGSKRWWSRALRAARRPVALLAVAAVLLVAAGLWVAVDQPWREAEPAPPTTPTTEPEETEPPPPPTETEPPETEPPPTATEPPPPPPGIDATSPEGLEVRGLRPVSTTSSATELAWSTNVPTTGRIAVGTVETGKVRWTPSLPLATDHRVTVDRLAFGRPYRLWLEAAAEDGRRIEVPVDVQTPGPPSQVMATTAGTSFQLDGSFWFPLMVWDACPREYPDILAAGINLFASNRCDDGLAGQLAALGGRALSMARADEPPLPGIVGAFYPDEADASGVTPATLGALPHGGIKLFTFSSHVFTGADQLPSGRADYPGLAAAADAVGVDIYPLQSWCQVDRLDVVHAAQVELVALAPGKPTFQWIEAAAMNCPHSPGHEITPTTVRAEAWLAITGGARGLGFFPWYWDGTIGARIADIAREVSVLGAYLAGPSLAVTVSPAASPVRAAGFRLNGAYFVAAVSPSRTPLEATVTVPGLGDRTLVPLGEGRTVESRGGRISDRFEPLAVHLYVSAPG